LLLAVPAVALVSAEVKASATVNCGQGPITVSPKPFIEVGTGWFVDGRGYLITNAHVIDPAYRVLPWVEFNPKLRAVDQTSAEVGPHVGQHVVLRDALALPVLHSEVQLSPHTLRPKRDLLRCGARSEWIDPKRRVRTCANCAMKGSRKSTPVPNSDGAIS
jgi:hypothetical protein